MAPELNTNKSVLLTDLALCVNRYRLLTTGIYVCVHAPVWLDGQIRNEQTKVVPGLVAMTNYGKTKQCEAEVEGFLGPPNFVLDVFEEHERAEYERRRDLFDEFGVVEYAAFFANEEPSVCWHRRESSGFKLVDTEATRVIRSKALPGMWIPTAAIPARDWWLILAAIERGATRLGHHEHQETIFHDDESRREAAAGEIPYDAL